MKDAPAFWAQAQTGPPATHHTPTAPPQKRGAAAGHLPKLIDCRWCGAVVPREEAECCERCGWTIAYCKTCAATQSLGMIFAPAPARAANQPDAQPKSSA